MDAASELAEAVGSIQIWQAPTKADAEATASLRCTQTSTRPPSLTEPQTYRMEPHQFNTQPNNPFSSSLGANTNGRINKEVGEVAEVATKAEAPTRNVLSSRDPTTITRVSSSKWEAVCTVRTNRDHTWTLRAKQTTKLSFASTSCKTNVPMKESVVLRTDKENLERNNQCNNSNNLTVKGHTKITATRLPNRTMDKLVTKSRSRCLFLQIMLLQTRTTTADSNSSSSSNSGSPIMGWILNSKTLKWATTCKTRSSSQTTSCKTTKLSHHHAEFCLTKRTPMVWRSVRKLSTSSLRQEVNPTLKFLPVLIRRKLSAIKAR